MSGGWRRAAVVPLLVWLLMVAAGVSVLLWQENNSRQVLARRFTTGVGVLGEYLTGVVAAQMDRELVQARASLSGTTVQAGDFDLVMQGLGFSSGVLLDATGHALQSYPSGVSLVGQNLAVRYEHLRIALQGTPVVSPVVLSAARAIPVVAFAVPYETPSGRRVLSGALPVQSSPLASYFTTALSLTGARVQIADTTGSLVAATDPFSNTTANLATQNGPLATALSSDADGRYHAAGAWWRYSSAAIDGTPWRLSATVREDDLFASLAGTELAGRGALTGATLLGLVVVVVIGRSRSGRRELTMSEHRFRKIFDGARAGMVLTDTQGRIQRVNPAACKIFGRTEDDLLGAPVQQLTHPDDAELAVPLVLDCLAGRIDGFDLDKRYVRADGGIVDASITTALITDEYGVPQYFVTQIIDTTEQRAHARERERQATSLREANTHLNDVIAMLSHDVRQPLAKIVGFGGLLREAWETLPDHTKADYVARITAAGHRANELVTDVLMLAQHDAGAIVAHPAHIDVAHAVRDAVDAHHISAGVPISVFAPDETIGLADPAQLRLILGNLLLNAAKYGRPPIEVTVVTVGDEVAIRVADHGEGVPPDFVPHLFDRFARASSGVATTTPGTGLGLYLVRQLAQAGGLDVTYAPNDPFGAVFTVTVPHDGSLTRPLDPLAVPAVI